MKAYKKQFAKLLHITEIISYFVLLFTKHRRILCKFVEKYLHIRDKIIQVLFVNNFMHLKENCFVIYDIMQKYRNFKRYKLMFYHKEIKKELYFGFKIILQCNNYNTLK